MKCLNCMARFCEQRCLTRYLDDLAEQEEARVTGNWLCPCCRGIEPVGKYKGSEIPRTDEEEEAEQPSTPQTNEKSAADSEKGKEDSGRSQTNGSKDTNPKSPSSSGTENEGEERTAKGSNPTGELDDYCAVCGDIYTYDNNAIIFCDGCNVAVHQACYGVTKIPEGEWLCDRCKAKTTPQCHLCGLKGGAMKQLFDRPHHWVHVTCVATLPECAPIELDAKIGPEELLERIDKQRWKLKCEICKEKNRKEISGPLIQCIAKKCTKAFHPICVQRKLVYSKELSIFVTHCSQHVPKGKK